MSSQLLVVMCLSMSLLKVLSLSLFEFLVGESVESLDYLKAVTQ